MKIYDDIYANVKGTHVDEMAYPRRFSMPSGYQSPKSLVASLAMESASATLISQAKAVDMPLTHSLAVTSQLVKYGVPTYFVDRGLCEAVVNTEPPRGIQMADIKWPMPAMFFVLPDAFVQEQFGIKLANIRVAKFENNLEMIELDVMTPYGAMPPIEFTVIKPPLLVITFHFFANGAEVPTNFFMRLCLDEGTVDAQHDLMLSLSRMDGIKVMEQTMTPEAEKIMTSKVGMFLIKLMLVMTARPNFMITAGECMRKAKLGKGRQAMWSPTFIGKGFRYQSKSKGTGTGNSPAMHWRDAHFTHQAHGPGRTLRRVIWIEEILVNAPE